MASPQLASICSIDDGIDDRGSRFAERSANHTAGEHPRVHPRHEAIGWSHVAAGMMLHWNWPFRSFETRILDFAHQSWIPRTAGLDLVLLADCSSKDTRPMRVPARLTARAHASVQWHCYHPEGSVWQALWRKTAALLGVLAAVPHTRVYLKLDVDTLVMPASMLRFLNSLLASAPRGPLYFGSPMGGKHGMGGEWFGEHSMVGTCRHPPSQWENRAGCFRRSRSFQRLRESLNQSARVAEDTAAPTLPLVTYAQGGAYGMDRRALELLSSGRTIERVAHALRGHRPFATGRLPEDQVMGLSMHLHGIALSGCACFHPISPCDVNQPHSCVGKLCHLPLTMHKMKRMDLYRDWWRLLSERETERLRPLEASHPQRL